MLRLCTLIALACPAAAAMAAPLVVDVANVRSASGRVRVDVCVEREFLQDACGYSGTAAARAGKVSVTVADVPPGRYAVQIYHDENGDGKLARGLFGMPKEGYGFSNDIKPGFGPPRFSGAAVDLGEQPARLAITMRY